MAKTATKTPAKQTTTKNAVSTIKQNTEVASAELAAMMSADKGKGVSTAMEDNVVPLVYILQSQSPQVLKKKEEYIEGAEAGNIWFRGSKEVIGDEGILVQPCFFSKAWIEWQPDRGGFAGRHDSRPEDAVLKTDPKNPKKKWWELPNGNTVVETREHVVLVHDVFDRPTPFVIPMSGSQHAASRGWMGSMNRKMVPGTDDPAPSFAYLYRMKTSFKSNDQGDWFMWEIEDENGTPTLVSDVGAYKMARKICDDFSKGVLRAGDADAENDKAQGEASEHI